MKPLILFLALCTVAVAAPVTPTQQQLDTLLTTAFAEWGVEMPANVSVILTPMDACSTRTMVGKIPNIAVIDMEDHPIVRTETSRTVITYTTGPEDQTVEESPEVVTKVETVHNYSYIIMVNKNCNWRDFPLDRVIEHEAGHIVTSLKYHSSDANSVMYEIPGPRSVITTADREMVGRVEAKR